jgi:hypothetical protein
MIKLTATEGATIGKAMLFLTADKSEKDARQIHQTVIKLVDGNMWMLATFAAEMYDETGDFPDIFPVIKERLGLEKAGEFSACVKGIRDRRATDGKDLNVIFVDENGVAENVVYMARYEHLRKAAA